MLLQFILFLILLEFYVAIVFSHIVNWGRGVEGKKRDREKLVTLA